MSNKNFKKIQALLVDNFKNLQLAPHVVEELVQSHYKENKKIFLAAAVAIPPYSGTTKINPSDLFKLSDIEFQVSPQTPFPFFLSD